MSNFFVGYEKTSRGKKARVLATARSGGELLKKLAAQARKLDRLVYVTETQWLPHAGKEYPIESFEPEETEG